MSNLINVFVNQSVDKTLIKKLISSYVNQTHYIFKYIMVYYTPLCIEYIIKYIIATHDHKIIDYILLAHQSYLCKHDELKQLHNYCKKECICNDKTYLDMLYRKFINLLAENPNMFFYSYINNSIKTLITKTDVIDNTLCTYVSKLYNDPKNWIPIIQFIRECQLFSVGYGDLIFKIKDDFLRNTDERIIELKTKKNISLLRQTINEYNNIHANFCEIIKNVFVGDIVSATNISLLKEQNFKHIISLTKKDVNKIRNIEYTQILIDDSIDTDFVNSTLNYYPKVIEQINNNHNILIHCHQGLSRSICFMLILLIKLGINYDDAYSLIKSKKTINPNPEFIKQIKLWINRSANIKV